MAESSILLPGRDGISYFDLHCDTVTTAMKMSTDLDDGRLQLSLKKTTCLEKWKQCFALFIPDEYRGTDAFAYYERCYDYFRRQLERFSTDLRKVSAHEELAVPDEPGRHCALLTVEGGSLLAARKDAVERLSEDGVWAVSLTWNGENELAGGCHAGTGLTELGKNRVRELEAAGITVDVSHLSEKAFYELCDIAHEPLIATHSDSRKICPHVRNLTDDQFRIIRDMGGIVGLNFYTEFIKEGADDYLFEDILRHAEHFLTLDGEKTLSLGSDFDGAEMPSCLSGADRIPQFYEYMRKELGEELCRAVFHDNAADFFIKRKLS